MTPLTQASEYAVRALTHLALTRTDGFQQVRRVAQEVGVPGPFLLKILQPLVQDGLLVSRRGRGGGYRLVRDPGDVTLFDVVASQQDLTSGRECMLGQETCSDERACPLHDYWRVAFQRFLDRLQRTTLADLVAFCARQPESGYPGLGPLLTRKAG